MSELKEFTLDQLSKLSTPTNLHLLISGKVYAIAKFLEDHPGGDEVLLSEAGKDASESFEDVGHSEEARTLMKQYLVGTCTQGVPKSPSIDKKPAQQASTSASNHQSGGGLGFMVPLALLAGYLSYRKPVTFYQIPALQYAECILSYVQNIKSQQRSRTSHLMNALSHPIQSIYLFIYT
ncbi:hypothetical protein PSTT_14573 [Puccinia striiformis]|uniref:Cytochrome b5 heme-binding domain-containing protein n=1 Tax=Puccinia striiformis TaxID=27350 RepID=A0A2S4ULN1_9BASI|nr:hypothetical protein PSTT_14573 [Puccinia striiformis]